MKKKPLIHTARFKAGSPTRRGKEGERFAPVAHDPSATPANGTSGSESRDEEGFRRLLSLMPAAVYTCDAAGRITYFNERAARLWGRTPRLNDPDEKFCGSFKLWLPDGSPLAHDQTPMARAVREGRPARNEEVVIERPDGSSVTVNVNIDVLYDDGGEPCGAINVFHDTSDQKRAEQALRQSEERYRQLVSSLPAAIYATDAEGRVTLYNEAAAELWGRVPEIGKDLWCGSWRIYQPDGRPLSLDACPMAVALKTGQPVRGREIVVERPDGTRRNVLPYPQPLRDAAGRTVGAIDILVDVTEQKLTEAALRRSEEQFRSLVAHLPAPVFVKNLEGRYILANPPSHAALGRPDVVGLTDCDLLPAGEAEVLRQHDREVIETGRRIEREQTVRGRKYLSVKFPLPGELGAPSGICGVAIDITGRLATESALRESEKRFRTLAEHAPVGIFMSDPGGGSVFVNNAWCEMTGLSAEQARGDGWLDAVHPEDRERITTGWKAAIDRGTPSGVEFRFQRPDGEVIWVYGNAVPLQDGEGVLTGYIGTITNITERRRSAQLLRDSERRFRHMADNAPVLIWIADTTRRYTWFNQRWLDFVGRTLDDEVGEGWAENVHPEDLMRCLQRYVEAFDTRSSFEMEYRLRRHDGEYRWMLDHGVPTCDESGAFTGYIGSCIDITERVESEALLRRQAIMLEQTHDAIFAWELDGGITYWGQGAVNLYEFTPEQALGRVSHRLLSTTHPIGMKRIDEILEREGQWSGELIHRARDGRAVTVESKLVLTRQPDGRLLVLQTNHDVTERRRAEQALRESEARFRQLADALPQIVWTAAADGKTDYFNRRWHELTGADATAPENQSFVPYLHPDDVERCREAWLDSVRTGEPFETEQRLKFPSLPNYRWFLGRALPVRDAGGNIVRWFGTCTNIDDMKRAEEKLEHAVAERTTELSETNNQLESFVYSIAHDLRTPLRAVEALSKILLDEHGDKLDETGRDFATRINRSAEFMDRLLLDLLEYGRTARTEMELEAVPVKDAWEAAVFQCQHQIREKNARVECVEPMPLVRANEASLGQVLVNLLSNALRFTRDGLQPHIRLTAEDAGPMSRLCVEDNGIGIKPEYHDRIFRVFERLHGHNYEGTGIGLAIVRKSVERMGGRVGVESSPGHGSRFWIELPRPVADSVTAPSASADGRRRNMIARALNRPRTASSEVDGMDIRDLKRQERG